MEFEIRKIVAETLDESFNSVGLIQGSNATLILTKLPIDEQDKLIVLRTLQEKLSPAYVNLGLVRFL